MNKSLYFSSFKLYNAEGFGDKSVKNLLEAVQKHQLSLEDVFELSPQDFEHYFPDLGKGKLKSASYENLMKLEEKKLYPLFEEMTNQDIAIHTLLDTQYPQQVIERMGGNAPSMLFSKGNQKLFAMNSIAIVGARNANEKTLQLTYQFAQQLANQNYNIVSGLAKGVDSQAHLGALENKGTTSMVLSFGLFELLKQKIFEAIHWDTNALAISQFDLNEKWRASNAMVRNKLVCALAKGVLVIQSGKERDETGKMSGTFDAAQSALAMGIPVFVLTPTHPCFQGLSVEGNRDLIKLGALEIQSVEDIVDYFGEELIIQPAVSNPIVVKTTEEKENTYQRQGIYEITHPEQNYSNDFSTYNQKFPLRINGSMISSVETLFQVCRYPHSPEIQEAILAAKDIHTIIALTEKYNLETRKDFEEHKKEIMRWCLRVKLAQNFFTFAPILESTEQKDIVVISTQDRYWGTTIEKYNDKLLTGANILGRLLKQQRKEFYDNKYINLHKLLYIEPPTIPDFMLLGKPIAAIDERNQFLVTITSQLQLTQQKLPSPPNSQIMGENKSKGNKINVKVTSKAKKSTHKQAPSLL